MAGYGNKAAARFHEAQDKVGLRYEARVIYLSVCRGCERS
jgi:hypothetical protein